MKILITYSSGYGTTREVAEKIGHHLGAEPLFKVDMLSVDDIVDIADYEAVILGTSVRAEHPLANIVDFITAHRHELEKKYVALFLVCLVGHTEEGREKIKQEYLPQLFGRYPRIQPVAVEAFGGKIDFDRLNPVMQSLMRRVLQNSSLPTEGSVDTRDWDSISEWAIKLREKLITLTAQDPASVPL